MVGDAGEEATVTAEEALAHCSVVAEPGGGDPTCDIPGAKFSSETGKPCPVKRAGKPPRTPADTAAGGGGGSQVGTTPETRSKPARLVVGALGWREYPPGTAPPLSGAVDVGGVGEAGSAATWRRLWGDMEHAGAMGGAEFWERFVTSSQPVVLRGAASNWEALKMWTPQHLAEVTFAVARIVFVFNVWSCLGSLELEFAHSHVQ